MTVSKPRCGCCGKPGTTRPWYMRQPSLPAKSWPRSRPASDAAGPKLLVAGGVGVVVVHAEEERVGRTPGEAERPNLAHGGIHAPERSAVPAIRPRRTMLRGCASLFPFSPSLQAVSLPAVASRTRCFLSVDRTGNPATCRFGVQAMCSIAETWPTSRARKATKSSIGAVTPRAIPRCRVSTTPTGRPARMGRCSSRASSRARPLPHATLRRARANGPRVRGTPPR